MTSIKNNFFQIKGAVYRKHYLVFVICSFVVLSCRKPESMISGSLSPEETSAGYIASQIKGTWVWDSTSLFLNNTLKYSYTPTQLKYYSAATTSIICTDNSTFTLNLDNKSAKLSDDGQVLAGVGSGNGYIASFDLFSSGLKSDAAALSVKGSSELTDTTLFDLDDNWLWMVYPAKDHANVCIFVRAIVLPRHKGISYIGRLIFFSGNYVITHISEHSLVLSVDEGSTLNDINNDKYYFHR